MIHGYHCLIVGVHLKLSAGCLCRGGVKAKGQHCHHYVDLKDCTVQSMASEHFACPLQDHPSVHRALQEHTQAPQVLQHLLILAWTHYSSLHSVHWVIEAVCLDLAHIHSVHWNDRGCLVGPCASYGAIKHSIVTESLSVTILLYLVFRGRAKLNAEGQELCMDLQDMLDSPLSSCTLSSRCFQTKKGPSS